METMVLVITMVAVLGLVGISIVQLVLARRERVELYKLIKSESLGEFITAVSEEVVEEEPEEVEIPVDEIPFIKSGE